jgi:hypothetical protein
VAAAVRASPEQKQLEPQRLSFQALQGYKKTGGQSGSSRSKFRHGWSLHPQQNPKEVPEVSLG